MAIGRQNIAKPADQRGVSVMGFAFSTRTMCEISYDTDWSSKDNRFGYRSPSTESRSSLQDYIGSLYADGRLFVSNSSPRPELRRSCSRPKETRSFTSLGTYNSKHLSNKRGSISVLESSRSTGHQPRSRANSFEAFSRDSSQNGDVDIADHKRLRWVDALNTWVPDRKTSQAFVTFVNGAPVTHRKGSATAEGNPQIQVSTSHELYRTKDKPEQPSPTRHRSAVCLPVQKSEEIFVKVENTRENVRRERRSQTAAPATQFSEKDSRVRFYQPPRQARSSISSLPPAPPPSMTPSKSADSSRCGTSTNNNRDLPGDRIQSGSLLEVTREEDQPSLAMSLAGPGGDDNTGSETVESVVDEEHSVQTKSRTHSRQGSSSSVSSDHSIYSKTSSALFMENIYAQHERKKLSVRWSTDSTTDRASSCNYSEDNDSIVTVETNTSKADKSTLDLTPRPVSPQLSTIIETEVAAESRESTQDLSKQVENEVPHQYSHSSTTSTRSGLSRKPIQKKVRKERKKEEPRTPTPPPPTSPSEERKLSCEEIIEEDSLAEMDQSFHTLSDPLPVIFADFPLPSLTETVKPEPKGKIKSKMVLPPTPEPLRKNRQRTLSRRHLSYGEEQMRQDLAENRRKKQQQFLERHRQKTYKQPDNNGDNGQQEPKETVPRFEDYDFLAKYCIFDNGSHESHKRAFKSVDTESPWLSGQQVIKALKSLNTKLSLVEDDYLRRILELMGYDVSKGADFKLFSVIAALSKRISALDSWMKDLIGKINFRTLEMKMYLWKTLWECNVDTESNTVSLDQLCVELRAGGVSREHEDEVRKKLGHLTTLDLLDFLSYIPLFVIIHESVIDNPLSDRRET